MNCHAVILKRKCKRLSAYSALSNLILILYLLSEFIFMNDTSQQLQAMQQFFQTGVTLNYDFRRKQLLALKKAMIDFEEEIYTALHADLKKSKEQVLQ